MIITNDVVLEPDTTDQSQNLVVEFFVKGDKVLTGLFLDSFRGLGIPWNELANLG